MKKRLLSFFLVFTLLCPLVPAMGVTASAEETAGTTQTVGAYTVLLPKDVALPDGADGGTTVTAVTAFDTTWGTASAATWYVATGTVEINNTVTVSGDVHLILADECDLKVTGNGENDGIKVSGETNSLTIYAQSEGAAMGKLTVASGDIYSSGIGSDSTSNGDITINGGKITASGGCGQMDDAICGRNVMINGGDISVVDSLRAVENLSIVGGKVSANDCVLSQGCINIFGGIVIADKGIYVSPDEGTATIHISGGSVTVNSETGLAAMGDSAVITISGEKTIVNVTGSLCGIYADASGSAADDDAAINILGGKVTAAGIGEEDPSEGDFVYGILARSNKGKSTVTVSDSEVNATGASGGVVIKGLSGGEIDISGGKVHALATGSNEGTYGLGCDGHTITITDCDVYADSGWAGINCGKLVNNGGNVYAGTLANAAVGINAPYFEMSDGSLVSNGTSVGIVASESMAVTGGTVIAKSGEGEDCCAVISKSVTAGDLLVMAGESAETAVNIDKADNYATALETAKYVRINAAVCYVDVNNNGTFDGSDIEYGSVQEAIKAVGTIAATIRLIADDTENVTIPEGCKITLDINGFVLDGDEKGSVIINEGTLTVKDSSIELSVIDQNNHRFKVSDNGLWENDDSIASDDADYIYAGSGQMSPHKENAPAITEKGTVIEIYGGVITGGSGTENSEGGGVTNKGTFTLASGNLVGNSSANSDSCHGGGVANRNDGTFLMNGGSIIGNYSYHGGGGIFNYTGTVRMNDGAILYNTAKESGGGIGNDGNVMISGGSISKNTAGNIGGGMYIRGGTQIPKGPFLPGGSLTIGGTAKIYENSGVKGNNVAVYSNSPNITIGTSTNGTDGNEVLKPAEGMNVWITLNASGSEVPTYGRFTTNGTKNDVQYTQFFFSDSNDYIVRYNSNSGGYLELYSVPTLYFGQNATNSLEYYLYTDAARTKHYTGGAGTWNVTWSVEDSKPQLNLDGFSSGGSRVQIDCDCVINVTNTNNISSEIANGLVINQNTIIRGDGSLNIYSTNDDAMAVKATASVEGAVVQCSAASSEKKDITFGENAKIRLVSGDVKNKNGASFYPSTLETLYLTKTSNKEYALYTDCETCNFEYAVGASGAEELADSNLYAVLNLTGELNKKIIFKQDETQTYTAVLRVIGTETKLGGFDASEGILTVQSENGKKVSVSGNVKAQKLYMVQCNGLTMEVVDGSILAAEKEGITNELMIGSDSDENKVNLAVKNGGIQFEKGAITIINADVTLGKNSVGSAADVGMNAHRINLDGSKLTVNDVSTGIKLYEPEQYGEGAVLSIGNQSTLSINAAEIGVQGTAGEGGNYYNNITVLDTESTITIAGGTKAVASAEISPVPLTKIVRSTDNKAVYFKINDDANYTTDYYYVDTANVAKALTLADATIILDNAIENGEISVSDPGAAAGAAVTVTVTPDEGYELDKITIKDKNGTDVTETVLNGTIITVPDNLPITVSATFKEKTTVPCKYNVPFAAGKYTLLLCGKEAGTFTITGNSCKGYALQNEEGYLALVDGKVRIRNQKFVWKYDGGLYAETKSSCRSGFWFWDFFPAKTTKQYLTVNDTGFTLSNYKVCAQLQVTAEKHTYKYLHDGDGKHEAYCIKCGHHEEPVKHTYGENGYCECGKLNPDLCYVKDVKVTEKKTASCCGYWFWMKNTTKVQYTICPKTQNVGVKKVEYSKDNEKWNVGTTFTSVVKLNEFYIRVTDTNGKVTTWKYKNGEVTPVPGL